MYISLIPVKSARNLCFAQLSDNIYNTLKVIHNFDFFIYLVNNNLENYYSQIQKPSFFQSCSSTPRFILSQWVTSVVKTIINSYDDNISYDTQFSNFYTSIIKLYKNNYEKLYQLTGDYILSLFYNISNLNEDEVNIILYMHNHKIDNIFYKYGINISTDTNNISLLNETIILSPVNSCENLLSSQTFTYFYISLFEQHKRNYVEYIFNNNIDKLIGNDVEIPFFQLTSVNVQFVFGVWVKNLIKNSIYQYEKEIDYSIQTEKLYSALMNTYQKSYENLYKLSTYFLLSLFYKSDKLTNEQIELILVTNPGKLNDIYVKFDLPIIIKDWNN